MDNWTGQYTWTLENYSRFGEGESTTSPEFEIGGHKWCFLLYPYGNSNAETDKHMSLYLQLPNASSTPIAKCPNVFFEVLIINQFDAERTFNGVGRHFYTCQAPSFGFQSTIPTSEMENLESGFVVNDSLTIEGKMRIIEDSIPNSNPVTLQESATAQSNRQDLVFLNVGGQSFKMAKSTLARFPESLLSKMVQEFPDLVEKREELYIDRNPKTFTWIHEIYRDGDFHSTLPDVSLELLENELEFYQLPLAEELGIKQTPNSNLDDGFHSPMVELFYEIMAEIKACNLIDLSSFSVFVYYRQVGNRKEGKRRVFVAPPDNFTISQCLLDRGHESFDNAIHSGSEEVTGSNCAGWTIIRHPATSEKFRVVNLENNKMIELLNGEASKFGMTVSHHSFRRGQEGNQVDIGLLKITYT